jgi:hypothetical protein
VQKNAVAGSGALLLSQRTKKQQGEAAPHGTPLREIVPSSLPSTSKAGVLTKVVLLRPAVQLAPEVKKRLSV